ncbi:hypothetical protein LXA43DRAFT_1102476 [Ganoderma leucocontextum]|nr:hypothetical protein LXA43DRAFT_1102476 [Ganoderma leucocontextum]
MSGPELGWEKCQGVTNAFTRPLLGSEKWLDNLMRLQDGSGQFAIGVQFTTTIHERDIETRLKEAAVRLRFECPLIAATIEPDIHHPECSSWVYAPLPNVDAARNWADETVYYLPLADPADPVSFLQSTVETHKIPYVLLDGSEQYLRIYLTRLNTALNGYCLSLHTAHSVLDAKPGLNALSLLLEWITTPGLGSVTDLPWDTEHKNLPSGPITATASGPRPEDWSPSGVALVQKFQSGFVNQTPSHGLYCDISGDSSPGNGNVHRFLVKFTAEESAKIRRALKNLGFRFSELLDAACILAAFEQNPVPADQVETAYMKSDMIVSLTERLPPLVDRRKHLVSCVVFASYRMDYAPLATLPRGRARLLAAMRQAKAQYDWWLANPHLPHLSHLCEEFALRFTASSKEPAPPRGPYAPRMSNIGRVEDYVALVWPRDGDRDGPPGEGPVVRVDEIHTACRMVDFQP